MRLPLACAAALALCLPTIATADDKPAKPDERPLWPLKKGAKWEWRKVPEDGNYAWRSVQEVVDVIKVGDLLCYKVQTTDIEGRRPAAPQGVEVAWTWKPAPKSEQYGLYAVKDDGVYSVGMDLDDRKSLLRYSPPIRLLSFRDKPADAWDADSNMEYTVAGEDGKEASRFVQKMARLPYVQLREDVTVGGVKYPAVRVAGDGLITWYVRGRGPVKQRKSWPTANGKYEIADLEATITGLGLVAVGDVVLNPGFVEKEVYVEEVDKLPGQVYKFKRSHTITHEVSFGVKGEVAAEGGGGGKFDVWVVKAEVSAKVRVAVEAEGKEKLKETETRELELDIPAQYTKTRVAVINLYKKGTVTVEQDGKSAKVPFEFPYGTKLVVRER